MGNHDMKFICNFFGYYIENVNPFYISVTYCNMYLV